MSSIGTICHRIFINRKMLMEIIFGNDKARERERERRGKGPQFDS